MIADGADPGAGGDIVIAVGTDFLRRVSLFAVAFAPSLGDLDLVNEAVRCDVVAEIQKQAIRLRPCGDGS